MNIIEIKNPYTKCARCGNFLEWRKDDIRHRDHRLWGMNIYTEDVILCPVCGQIIPLK